MEDQKKQNNMIGGLQPLPRDKRDFNYHKSFGAISELPTESFLIGTPLEIKQQYDTDMCFPANTQVMMEDFSYNAIQDITVGDYVYTHEQQLKKVKNTFRRKWQGTMVKIKVKGDYRILQSTPNHPYYIMRDNEMNFIEAKDIKETDYIAFPKLKFEKDTTLHLFEREADFLWVLGMYLAEGSINDKYRVVFTLHINETEYAKRIKEVMGKYGGKVYFVENEEHNTRMIYLAGIKWVNIFTELGGKYCNEKELHKRLMFLSPQLQMNIVQGFYDGDGYIRQYGKTVISTSKRLLIQMRIILARNNFMSSFCKRKEREDRLPAYTLEYYPNKEHKTYLEDDDYFYVKIVSIEHNSKEYFTGGNVYNLEVEDDQSYIVNGLAVHNCTAFASCSLSEFQEGVILSPEYQFAKTKQIEGDYLTWGADLRTACKSLVKFGSLEKKDAKLDVADNDRDKIANWANWSFEDDMKAREHRKQSYFAITKQGHKDLFDALRSALWDNKKAKRAIITGLLWRQNWTYLTGGLVPKNNDLGSYGHSFIFIGQKIIVNEPYLVAQLSNGNIGDEGLYYFPREVVNKECRFGNFMHIDIPPEEVKKVQWGFRQRFMNFLINIKL